jgi:hypothetical protein
MKNTSTTKTLSNPLWFYRSYVGGLVYEIVRRAEKLKTQEDIENFVLERLRNETLTGCSSLFYNDQKKQKEFVKILEIVENMMTEQKEFEKIINVHISKRHKQFNKYIKELDNEENQKILNDLRTRAKKKQ